MVDYRDGKIYQIVNNVNNIVYVGSTAQPLAKRMVQHRSDALTKSSKFHTAMRAVGIANFRIVLIKNFQCNRNDELYAEEYKTMKDFQQQGVELYNDFVGVMSEEQRQKISDANKGKVVSEETKQKLSESHIGKVASEETKQRMSEARKGKVVSEETKQKIGQKNSENLKGKLQEDSSAFNYGSLVYNDKRNSWIFRWQENQQQKSKSFSIYKYGYYRAKMLAMLERKRVYPMWQIDEVIAIDELAMIEL